MRLTKKKRKNQAGRLARFARVAREHHHGAREPAEEGRPRSARAALVHGGGDGGGGGGSRFPSLNGDRERLWCRSRCRAFATARGQKRETLLRTGIWHEEHTTRRQLQLAEIQRKSRVREWTPQKDPRIRAGVTKEDQKAELKKNQTRRCYAEKTSIFFQTTGRHPPGARRETTDRAGLETFGLVHEHKKGSLLRPMYVGRIWGKSCATDRGWWRPSPWPRRLSTPRGVAILVWPRCRLSTHRPAPRPPR